MFITLEGGEGSGKSTQAKLLVERLRSAGYPVRLTREPGGTPLAGAIRALLLQPDHSLTALRAAHLESGDEPCEPVLPVTELLLLSAARAQHVQRIRGWLEAGESVVCDRFTDATYAYQGAGRGMDERTIQLAESLATGGLSPDVTILLDLPVDEGQRRREHAHRNGGELNRLDREASAFHERVRSAYLERANAEPRRWLIVDALPDEQMIARHIWSALSVRLGDRTGEQR